MTDNRLAMTLGRMPAVQHGIGVKTVQMDDIRLVRFFFNGSPEPRVLIRPRRTHARKRTHTKLVIRLQMVAIDADDRRVFIAHLRQGPVQIAHGHAEATSPDGVDGLRNGQCFHRSRVKCAQARYYERQKTRRICRRPTRARRQRPAVQRNSRGLPP